MNDVEDIHVPISRRCLSYGAWWRFLILSQIFWVFRAKYDHFTSVSELSLDEFFYLNLLSSICYSLLHACWFIRIPPWRHVDVLMDMVDLYVIKIILNPTVCRLTTWCIPCATLPWFLIRWCWNFAARSGTKFCGKVKRPRSQEWESHQFSGHFSEMTLSNVSVRPSPRLLLDWSNVYRLHENKIIRIPVLRKS